MNLEEILTKCTTVEYTDPAGVFESIRASLERALPLTNLHWNSSSRPLRSIPSLPVDLVPDAKTSSQKAVHDTEESSDNAERGSSSQDGGQKKERRHQIPGLRQTPYVKLYLLQCDDIDTYRSSLRQPLRDWVTSQAPISSAGTPIPKSKQENHDAFEWLILHLTNDGTNSSRPTSTRAESEGSKKPSASRWTSRGSKSVIDKIRSDFNGSSKHAIDRAAQVHLPSASQQPHQLESKVHDATNIWDDLLSRMKSSILSSFSLRVQQYEEDIKEKDLQRSLPGWNFNTFFVLKEGLARGFESVNLIEDALSGYQQLAAGLSAVIDEQLDGEQPGQQSTRFEACTTELRQTFEYALQTTKQQHSRAEAHMRDVADLGSYILDTDRKPFRVLILENNISIFDFQCYLFARQVFLLLRLANANDNSSKRRAVSQSASRSDADLANKPVFTDKENLLILADVVQLALDFIPSSAYSVRREIDGLMGNESSFRGEWGPRLRNDVIDNMIASWMFSACRSVLEVVSTRSLSIQLEAPLRQLRRATGLQATSNNRPSEDTSPTPFPRRASSLSFRSPFASPTGSHQFSASTTSLDTLRQAPQSSHLPGLANLAGLCGDLVLLSRRTLSNTALRLKEWQVGFGEALSKFGNEYSDMHQVELDDDSEGSFTAVRPSTQRGMSTEAGITNKTMSSALRSREAFFALFEDLTAATLAHFIVADRGKMAEAMTTDLALLCFILGDFNIAASYFKQLTSFYSDKQWVELGTTMLSMWATCLKEIDNTRQYITVSLRAIASIPSPSPSSLSRTASINELLKASKTTDEEISILAEPYLRLILESNLSIQHLDGRGGFGLLLKFRSLFREGFEADHISVCLLSVDREHRYELVLTSASTCNVVKGANSVQLISKTMRPGVYIVKKAIFRAGNIVFTDDKSSPKGTLDLPGAAQDAGLGSMKDDAQKKVLVWSNPQNLSLDISPNINIDLSKPRTIFVQIRNGLHNVSAGTLILRPASAGLRLHTSKVEATDGGIDTTTALQPGSINFGKIASNTDVRINVPYNIDTETNRITIKAEVNYTTDDGNFMFASDFNIPTGLSITVNVQDTFQKDALFSRFTVASATGMPVQVLDSSIQDSDSFEAYTAPTKQAGVTSHAGQAYSLIAKICPKQETQASDPTRTDARRLFLRIEYLCLDEAILAMWETSLLDALAAAKLKVYSNILCQHVRKRFYHMLTAHDIEMFSLLQEYNMGNFGQHEWSQVLSLFAPAEAKEIEQCLQKWHSSSRRSRLTGEESMTPKRSLTVPVDIPNMMIVHTAQLKIYKGTLEKQSPSLMMALDQVLQAKLTIQHTRKWGESRAADGALGFCYDIEAVLDDWLIGGQRSARFSAKEGEIHSFHVLLLPQRTGHLMLPSISIYSSTARPRSSDGKEVANSRISCETDYLNEAESVMVVPDLCSTTVIVDPNGGSTPGLGRVKCIEFQSRQVER